MKDVSRDNDFVRVNPLIFEGCSSESIDYAVMEKTEHAVVVPMDAGWSDIGLWSSLWDISKKDSNGSAAHGDVLLYDTSNPYVRTDDKLVVGIGLDDLVAVSTKDGLIVVNKDSDQDKKKVADELKQRKRTEWELHREVYRPWGMYDSIDNGKRCQVKRITVNPEAKLSVKMHYHRAEH